MTHLRTLRCLLPLALVLTGLALPADSLWAEDGDTYQFVFRAHGNSDWVGMRYRADSGETWRAVKGRWVKVEEKGAAPEPGTYRVQLLAQKDLNSWWAFRYDVHTGRTWRLSGGNWIDMPTDTP